MVRAGKREYGARHSADESHPVLSGIKSWPMPVWMSHGDKVENSRRIPRDRAQRQHLMRGYFNAANTVIGVQFHPEVTHTGEARFFHNFLSRSGVQGRLDDGFLHRDSEEMRLEIKKLGRTG